MPTAILSDIHGNIEALKKVLDDVMDQKQNSIEVRCIDYDIEKTVQGILDRGFPEHYAWRLK